MPRRMAEPVGMVDVECPRKRIAPNGNKLPDPIEEGEILTDVTGKQWRLGKSIGVGGFGEIYLASADIMKTVGSDAHHVVKVEPHKNGPLFVERSFYIRAGKAEMIEEWKRRKRLKHLGIPCYYGSGSHTYKGEKYRFLVLERFGEDLNKVFLRYGRRFNAKTVFYLGIQILEVLEYIHSHGYIHADIKGSNLLKSYERGKEDRIYLLDFGLACHYVEPNGSHKEYRCDQRKAHNGTLEFTSRDAHTGAHSRRGDLEILGYNMLQWLCSKLPWEDSLPNEEYVHEQKKTFMSNIPNLLRRCFPNSEPPVVLGQYLKYVAGMEFSTQPDYGFCKKLLHQGVVEAGFVDDGKLEFSNSCLKTSSNKIRKRTNKRCATDEPENIAELKPKKIIRISPRQPCVAHNFNRLTRNSPSYPVLRSHLHFNWEKVLSSNPEEKFKKGHTNRNVIKMELPRAKLEIPCAFVPVKPADPGKPTPAMLEVMSRIKERSLCPTAPPKRTRNDSSRCSSPTQEPVNVLTPAMEQVIQRREQQRQEWNLVTENQSWLEEEGEYIRTTRSGVKRRPPRRKSPRNRIKTAVFTDPDSDYDNEDDYYYYERPAPTRVKKKAVAVKKSYRGQPSQVSTRMLRKNILRG